MKYPNVSSREMRLLDELDIRDILVFGPLEASYILEVSRTTANTVLSRMESKGLVERFERGKYISRAKLDVMDIYDVACHVVQPSYISLWSGLHIYRYTTQVPRITYLMVAIHRPRLEVRGQILKFVKTRHFFGYVKQQNMILAEPEKLFLDCLMFPEYCGGIGEIQEALIKAELDEEKIVDYALHIDNRSLNSRLGYLLEDSGKKYDTSALRRNASKTYIPLDTREEDRGPRDKRWMITDNRR